MSSTFFAPYKDLGAGGDYPIEVNYAIRIYDNLGETIPQVGETSATAKGGLRTNFIGIVPLLDGKKQNVGKAEVLKIVIAKPENISAQDYEACGFSSKEMLIDYVEKMHGDEYRRDGVISIFYFRVIEKA